MPVTTRSRSSSERPPSEKLIESNKTKISQNIIKATSQILISDWLMVVAFIFGGCCSNVFTLEVLVKERPHSGHLITLCQFLLVSLEGLYNHLERAPLSENYPWLRYSRFKQRSVPITSWLIMVSLFWAVSVLNNWALAFDIPMPFHIIFRSAGLIVSLIMSWIVFHQRYSRQQISAVILVTGGIVVTTMASSLSKSQSGLSSEKESNTWLIGLGLLVIALFLSAIMGQYQQYVYAKYGKVWKEGLFYMHFLSLPAFALVYKDIFQEINAFSQSPPVLPFQFLSQFNIPYLNEITQFSIPFLWYHLIMNTLTQYACISGVQKLSSMASAVTLNLVLSLRKFTSLIISITLFKNHFTTYHWVGTAMVFIGTAWYSSAKSVKAQDLEKKKQ